MNSRVNIFIILLIFSGHSLFGQMGHAIVTGQPIYEENNNYFPHDYFVKHDMGGLLSMAVSINVQKHELLIKNKFNDGYTGHEVQFTMSSDLEIIEVLYQEWDDIIDGSKSKFTVDKVILSLNDNPFKEELITAHYTLQIKSEFFAGKLLSNEGVKDTTSYQIFNGKFKIYSENEKLKGRNWIIDQNEIKMGIKDSLGVYARPDEYAKYKFGKDSLMNVLKKFEIDRTETNVKKKGFVTLKLIIDERGQVEPESMTVWEPMKSLQLIERFKENSELMTNWYPATYKGKPVKSELNLGISIK